MANKTACGILFSTALLLSACGGSSDPAAGGPGNNLSGTAAIGAPIANAQINAICRDGRGFDGTVVTNANGAWSVQIDPARLPCALQVSFGNPVQTLHSYAATEGTANITPLTDLVIALASGDSPANWFASGGLPANPTASSNVLINAMKTAGYTVPPGDFDPFSTPFNPVGGDAYDDLLEALKEAVEDDAGLSGHSALVDAVKNGDLGSLPSAPDNTSNGGDDSNGGGDPGGGGGTVGCGGGAGATSELPSGPDLISTCAGTYDVTQVLQGEHMRGTVTIGADNGIDFDTGLSFTAATITVVSDRIQAGDRIEVNYQGGEKIQLFRTRQGELRHVKLTRPSGDTDVSLLQPLAASTRDGTGLTGNLIVGTLNDVELKEETLVFNPLNEVFNLEGANSNYKWSLLRIPSQVGTYYCVPAANGISIQHKPDTDNGDQQANNGQAGGNPFDVGRCTINVTRVTGTGMSVTAVEGTFSVELLSNVFLKGKQPVGVVTDGYFRYER